MSRNNPIALLTTWISEELKKERPIHSMPYYLRQARTLFPMGVLSPFAKSTSKAYYFLPNEEPEKLSK